MTINFKAPDIKELKPRILVLGIGGAGGNAINGMIESDMQGVEFVAVNTDAQDLKASKAKQKIQLGLNLTKGLGAGAKVEIGQAAADESLNEIMDLTSEVSVMRQGEMVGHTKTKNTSKEQLAEMMVGRSVLLRLDKSEVKAGEVLFKVKNLSVKDDLDVTRVKNVDLEIRSGEILGLAGVTGNGQTELLEALSGIRKVESGEIYLEGQKVSDSQNFLDPRELKDKGLAHVPEDRQRMGLVTDFKAYENLIFGYHDQQPFSKSSVLNHRDIISHSKKIMEEYDVRPQSPNLITSNFSGGNQQKIILSRELNENPKVLLVGQPTRGVDIGAIEFIHQRLIDMRDRGAAILLVSVELDEVLSLSDRIVVMFDGKIVGEKDNKNVTDRELGLLMAGVV